MKIYTKRGDDGTTALFGGGRRPKHDIQIDTYGKADELGAYIGQAIAFIEKEKGTAGLTAATVQPHIRFNLNIQQNLFKLGAILAGLKVADSDKAYAGAGFWETETKKLENAIDELEKHLPPLKSFIVSGGSTPGAALHVVRTQTRVLERRFVELVESNEEFKTNVSIHDKLGMYINRLSDYYFVFARYMNHLAQAAEEEVDLG